MPGVSRNVLEANSVGAGVSREPDRSESISSVSAREDVACLRRMAAGDQSGVGLLYDRHSGAVYSLAYRVLADAGDAEDVVQEVFAQAWRQAGRFEPTRSSVLGWLLMMTRSRSIDRVRARSVRPSAGSGDEAKDAIADERPNPETTAVTRQEAARLGEALAGLEPLQREALELAYYKGMSQSEIARALGQPLGTVKTRVRTALARLRSALGTDR